MTVVAADVSERVRQCVAALIAALDSNNADEFAGCFAEDGYLYATGRGITSGHEALREYIERTAAGRPVHALTSVLGITEDASGLSAQVPFVLINASSGELDARGDMIVTAEMGDGRCKFSSVRFSIGWASAAYRASGRCMVEGDSGGGRSRRDK